MYQKGSNIRFHKAQSYVANLAKMVKYRVSEKLKSQFQSFWTKYSFLNPTSIKQKLVHDIQSAQKAQGKEHKYMWCHEDNPKRPFPISIQDLPMFILQPADNTFRELWTSIVWVNTLLMSANDWFPTCWQQIWIERTLMGIYKSIYTHQKLYITFIGNLRCYK